MIALEKVVLNEKEKTRHTSGSRETVRHDASENGMPSQVRPVVGHVGVHPVVGVSQHLRDCSSGDQRLP